MKLSTPASFLLLLVFLCGLSSFETRKKYCQKYTMLQKKDTIEFKMHWDVDNDCKKDCIKYVAYDIITVNGDSALSKQGCYSLFVQCPSPFSLQKGGTYRFLAQTFRPTSCTTEIDTCSNHHFIKLLEKLP